MYKRLMSTSLAVLALIAVAGCGSSDSGGDDSTIRIAYADQVAGGLDPAVFYSVEGDDIILAAYETLLTYEPDSKELAPGLAKSWEVSDDGKTYTFELQEGVTFHDGTPMDATAVKKSFERAIEVKGGPSYMLDQVDSIETPDESTVVIELTQPVSAFLDYNASMYGPKVVSPTAVKENAEGDDLAQKWLSENEAGTGPYQVTSYKPAGPIVLERYDDYWGEPAKTETIEFTIVPNIGDQILQLRSGQLDMLTHGIDAQQIPSLEDDPNLQVQQFEAGIRPVMLMNVSRPPFDDPAVRQAWVADMDAASAAEQVYGDAATPATTVVPPIVLDPEVNPLPDPGPPVKAPTSQPVALGYTNSETDLRRLAEVMQQSLEKQGWNVRLQADSVAAQFGYGSDPTKAPEAAITTLNPDAAHPAAWLNPIYQTGGGINLLGFSDPKLDKQFDQAVAAVSPEDSERLYGAAAEDAGASWYATGIADRNDVIAARSDISGFTHVPVYIWAVKLADLEKG